MVFLNHKKRFELTSSLVRISSFSFRDILVFLFEPVGFKHSHIILKAADSSCEGSLRRTCFGTNSSFSRHQFFGEEVPVWKILKVQYYSNFHAWVLWLYLCMCLFLTVPGVQSSSFTWLCFRYRCVYFSTSGSYKGEDSASVHSQINPNPLFRQARRFKNISNNMNCWMIPFHLLPGGYTLLNEISLQELSSLSYSTILNPESAGNWIFCRNFQILDRPDETSQFLSAASSDRSSCHRGFDSMSRFNCITPPHLLCWSGAWCCTVASALFLSSPVSRPACSSPPRQFSGAPA